MDQCCFGRLVAEMQSLRWTTCGHEVIHAMFSRPLIYDRSSADYYQTGHQMQIRKCAAEMLARVRRRTDARSLQATRLVARHSRPGDP